MVPHMIDVLGTVLIYLDRRDQRFMAGFARKRGRIRRYVAHSPKALYPGKPHLAVHARKIGSRWWMGTNYDGPGIKHIIEEACAVAEVKYGTDIIIDF